jgi:putative membrane protein
MLKNFIAIVCVAALPAYGAERPDGQIDRAEKAAETADKLESKTEAKTAGATGAKSWIAKAAEAGLAEVTLGKLALERAQSPAVKEFAQRMVDDHSKSNEELMKIASNKRVTPPAQLAEKHRKLQQELTKTQGADFDKKYMDGQVKDHQEAIALFEKGAKSKDPQVQQFASSQLPALKEHLAMAQKVHTKASAK